MGLVMVGPELIPPPAGIDMSDMESLQANGHLLEARHFVFPFLAHALGTFVGALITCLIAIRYRLQLTLFLGAWYLLGGVVAASMIPSPTWFLVLDLLMAYLPMAWLAYMLGSRLLPEQAASPASSAESTVE
jgi:hypothetical protein